MSAEDIKALVRRWFEAWNDGKVAVSPRRRKSANFASRLKSEISLQTLANGLSAENWELRNRMAQMELANTKREQKIAALEQKLVEVERVLAELKGLLQNVEEEQKT